MDKTQLICELATGIHQYFLARPRGFGKTLLVSTLAELFAGRRALFEGLAITRSSWKWRRWPVLRFDFSEIGAETPQVFRQNLLDLIVAHGEQVGAAVNRRSIRDAMRNLIEATSARSGQRVVLLVDEYDSPLHRCVDRPKDFEAVAGVLEDFFVITKNYPRLFRFVFVTGVTRFSKAALFPGATAITNISRDGRYAALCGFTQRELETHFAPYIARLAAAKDLGYAECIGKIASMCGGFCFSTDAGAERVYSPLGIGNLFASERFIENAFESTAPSFITACSLAGRRMKWRNRRVRVTDTAMEEQCSDQMGPAVLLCQAGFLTIRGYDARQGVVSLGFPNKAARRAYYQALLPHVLSR